METSSILIRLRPCVSLYKLLTNIMDKKWGFIYIYIKKKQELVCLSLFFLIFNVTLNTFFKFPFYTYRVLAIARDQLKK